LKNVETYLITLASSGNKQLQWTSSKNKWYDITTTSKAQRNNNKIWKQMDQLVVNQMHKTIPWKETHGNLENGKEQEILC